MPDSTLLWARLHGTNPDGVISSEDGSGVSVLKNGGAQLAGRTVAYASGIGMGTIPYGGAHTTLGLLPVMLHPAPRQVAIIGLGSGETPVAAAGRPETAQVTVIEIVASELAALQQFAAREPDAGLSVLLSDPRMRIVFGDGRTYIRLAGQRYDMIEADALRATSAYAGNLYSAEYFRLLQAHLNPGGYAVTWAPSARTKDTFTSVFPYVLSLHAEGDVDVLIGSDAPLAWDPALVARRLAAPFTQAYYRRAGVDLTPYLIGLPAYSSALIGPATDRRRLTDINTDLFPKDEYLVPR